MATSLLREIKVDLGWIQSNVSQNFVEHRLKRFWSMVCVDSVEDYGSVRF